MIETACEIVEIPGGGLAALMPLPDLNEKHWVAVREAGPVFHAEGRVHRQVMSYRVADRPWEEQWKPMGTGDVIVRRADADFDIGGGD